MLDYDRISWVALGDSFTSGVGDYPSAGGWVARTARLLAAEGFSIDLDNHAHPGVTVDAVLSDQTPMLPRRATIVSAIAGANDLLRYRYEPSSLAENVEALLDLAKQCGEIVLTSTCPDFFVHRFGPGNRLTRRVEALNATLRKAMAVDSDCMLLLDTHRLLSAERLWHRDGIHPNPVGHRALASEAVDLLAPRLSTLATGLLVPRLWRLAPEIPTTRSLTA
jgi:lysophospholipase L1-like esterase